MNRSGRRLINPPSAALGKPEVLLQLLLFLPHERFAYPEIGRSRQF